jgi:hypothetical protein
LKINVKDIYYICEKKYPSSNRIIIHENNLDIIIRLIDQTHMDIEVMLDAMTKQEMLNRLADLLCEYKNVPPHPYYGFRVEKE